MLLAYADQLRAQPGAEVGKRYRVGRDCIAKAEQSGCGHLRSEVSFPPPMRRFGWEANDLRPALGLLRSVAP